MTSAKRVSAIPGNFYFADPKQLTPLPVIGTLGPVTPLLVLFWREASSLDTSSECHKKNIPQQKIRDMFVLFFGVIGGSTNAIDRIFISTA